MDSKQSAKSVFRKPRIIELDDESSIKDYFLLTVVLGVGLFFSILAFVVSVHFQYQDALHRFRTQVYDKNAAVEFHVQNTVLNFEILAESLEGSNSQRLSKNYRWLERRIEESLFSCVMIVDLTPKSLKIRRQYTLKAGDGCLPTDLYSVSPDLAASKEPSAEQKGFLRTKVSRREDGHYVFSIVRLIKGSHRYLMVDMPLKSLIPESSQSPILADVMSAGGIQISSPTVAVSEDLLVFQELEFFGQSIKIGYWPEKGIYEVRMAWSWAVLGLGLIIVSLFGFIVYNLVDRNIVVSNEVRKKTHDLTEATQKAMEANETKSRFLANISHEVRTPLNLILGMADLLSETPVTKEQKGYIETFKRAGSHLLELINDVLDIARIETGEVTSSVSDVDLVELIENVSDFIAPACRVKKLVYNHSIGTDIPRLIKSDSKRLRQILINLVNNAMKFTDRGRITLTAARGEENGEPVLLLEVSDTGMGIPEAAQERIFEEFFQVDATSKRQHGGVGLGLSIVKTYVQHMGGTVRIRSEVGTGSAFIVSLPLKMDADVSWLDEEKLAREAAGKKRKICILSANPLQTKYVQSCLEWIGHDVTVMESGRSVLRRLKKSRAEFDNIIVDVVGSDVSGLEFVEEFAPNAEESAKFVILLPLVHRGTDTEDFQRFGTRNICFTPVKIRTLITNLDFTAEGTEKSRSAAAQRGDTVPALTEGCRLIIAEDDVDNRFLLQSYLAHHPLDVTFVDNGADALELYKTIREGIDLIITDIQMPKMDGFELIEKIREYERDHSMSPVPLLALTADALNEQHDKAISLGADGYLTKPISKVTLLAAISRHHRSHGGPRAALATIPRETAHVVPETPLGGTRPPRKPRSTLPNR